MAVKTQISLTERLSVVNAAHIVYLYEDEHAYIDNAVSFIEVGIKQHQRIILIDTQSNWLQIQTRLTTLSPKWEENVMYVDSNEFYRCYGDFQYERVLHNLQELIDPFVADGTDIRLWGLVEWRNEPDMADKLHIYESTSHKNVSHLGFLTVCAYNANVIPGSIELNLMRTHQYLMTDEELARSPLYHRKSHKSKQTVPSLTRQVRMESEVDLYRHKLDFVHVVSHEVRNPLTIVQAYASLLKQAEDDREKQVKLATILDYCKVIDYELSHIIETEQMLVAESIWQINLVNASKILHEVLDIMKTKARTQNVALEVDAELASNYTCLSNVMSLRLIFSNLISNALKYSHEGSRVLVAFRRVNDVLQFVVHDYGIGMTEKQLSRLYRKYEKQNESASGHGVGLYMVKTLVDKLGGTIQFQSRLNEGTRVEVDLPYRG